MFLDVNIYIDFLKEFNLTQTQFLVLHLLYKKNTSTIRKARKYTKDMPQKDIDDLETRGFIVKKKNSRGKYVYVIGEKFQEIYIDYDKAAIEFWELYPVEGDFGSGTSYPLKAMDMSKFVSLYKKACGGYLAHHQEMMKDLQFAIDTFRIKTKLQTYMEAQMWLQHRKLRLAEVQNNVQSNEAPTSNGNGESNSDNDNPILLKDGF
jgi:DNA-binding MarR family transcriptional regulator